MLLPLPTRFHCFWEGAAAASVANRRFSLRPCFALELPSNVVLVAGAATIGAGVPGSGGGGGGVRSSGDGGTGDAVEGEATGAVPWVAPAGVPGVPKAAGPPGVPGLAGLSRGCDTDSSGAGALRPDIPPELGDDPCGAGSEPRGSVVSDS